MAKADTTSNASRPSWRRWLRWVVFALIVGLALAWFMRPRWYGVPVSVVTPSRGVVVETVVSSGRVLAPSQVKLGSAVVGTVRDVAAREGDRVSKGQLLVQLQDDEARAAVARAEATLAGVAAARLDLGKRRGPSAREALNRARVDLAQAQADDARDASLAKDGAIAPNDRQRSKTALALAQSRVRAAEIEARAARPEGTDDAAIDAQEADAQAALESAKARLDLFSARAPVDGVVLTRQVEPGNVVQPGTPLFVLAEAGQDRLVIEPDEKNLRVLALGQPALASADAFPDQRFAAKVSWIAPTIDARRGTVEVHLALEGPQDFLKSDMTVSVEIEVARKANALTLPRAVVQDLAAPAPWVLVVVDKRAQKQAVTLGLKGDDEVEISAGLDERSVVVRPAPALPAVGALVRVPKRED